MVDLPFNHDKTIEVTADNLPDHYGESGVDVEIRAYDYDPKDHSAVMTEMVIDGQTVRNGPDGLNKDDRGEYWDIVQEGGRWYFQVLIDGEVHQGNRRHDLDEFIAEDVAYEVGEYEQNARIAENYDDLSPWDVDELESEIRSLERDISEVRPDSIQSYLYGVIREGNIDEAREGIEMVRSEIAKAQEAVDELEEVVDRVEQARVDE